MTRPDSEKSYFQNWISVIGAIGAIFIFSALVALVVLDFIAAETNPYTEAITYLILPGFLVAFLLLIPLGIWRERWRRHKRGYVRRFPEIDFNNPAHQRIAFLTIALGTVFILFSLFGTYKAYEFTESVTFCGRMCHQVMEPEFTAYHNSPHARVACVQCHIGPGADWYVKSKLSGLYQIYSTFAHKYSKPIDTPIENLRPAQETCEQCHWPQHFFGAIEQNHEYFLPDETNTPWKTQMLIPVGGGQPPEGRGGGIHWHHMAPENQIFYVASDEDRQQIPWVKVVNQNGEETVYVDKESDYSASSPPEGEVRLMDCMDCHNRPSHIYHDPTRAVNEAMAGGTIDPALPYVKREAVRVLVKEYASKEEALTAIRNGLEAFYKKEYPDLWETAREKIEAAIVGVIDVYQNNFFPRMNVSWRVYPDNIGHFIFPGCFRCHGGTHESAETGQVITNDCTACHRIVAQGTEPLVETSLEGLEFKHPEDIGDMWKEMKCYDCHTGETA